MTRLRGRSHKGSRCHASAPCGHWKTLTMLSSIRLDGTTECVVYEGATDKAMFREYIVQILCPALRPNDIVVMDNLSSHKNPELIEQIKNCGAELLYLPPYSPDLNPIENMWSKVKQLLRGMEIRACDALEKGIASALDSICASDAQGWFKNCGYELFQE
jgi:Transposase and inactivated derivatives